MSATRAINLTLQEADVEKRCEAASVAISAIEPLRSGGTHLVCKTIEGADQIRELLAKFLIDGSVVRTPYHIPPSRWKR